MVRGGVRQMIRSRPPDECEQETGVEDSRYGGASLCHTDGNDDDAAGGGGGGEGDG